MLQIFGGKNIDGWLGPENDASFEEMSIRDNETIR
jgi:hypothetical protein